MFHDVLALHVSCSASHSPTGYRFGGCAPTRLVRLGGVCEATVSGTVKVCGALPNKQGVFRGERQPESLPKDATGQNTVCLCSIGL